MTRYENRYYLWRARESAKRHQNGGDGQLTQEKVAEEAGVDRKVISDLERGVLPRSRSPFVVGRLAAYYGITVDELLELPSNVDADAVDGSPASDSPRFDEVSAGVPPARRDRTDGAS